MLILVVVSAVMIYAYARPGRQTVDSRLAFFQERNPPSPPLPVVSPELAVLPTLALGAPQPELDEKPSTGESIPTEEKVVAVHGEDKQDVTARQARVEIKNATMSTLSIYLTLLSIGVAFSFVPPPCVPYALPRVEELKLDSQQDRLDRDYGSGRGQLCGLSARGGGEQWTGREVVERLGQGKRSVLLSHPFSSCALLSSVLTRVDLDGRQLGLHRSGRLCVLSRCAVAFTGRARDRAPATATQRSPMGRGEREGRGSGEQ